MVNWESQSKTPPRSLEDGHVYCILPLPRICILGNGEAALWGWCGLGTRRGCGMALAKECGHQFFVVVIAHCGLVWFLSDFSFVSIELHPRLFTPCLTCIYDHLQFESIS